jgi:hypothetical protein
VQVGLTVLAHNLVLFAKRQEQQAGGKSHAGD